MANILKNMFSSKKTVKESTVQQLLNEFGGSMDSKFARDIFTKKQRKLHDEMRLCKEAYRENSLVHASVETMVDLIKGDKNIIDTDNLVLKKYMEEKHLEESGFNEANDVCIREAVITGNGYIELVLRENGTIQRYLPVVNSEDIYIDYNYDTDTVIRYIQRIYLEKDLSKDQKSKYAISIRTPYGFETVYGKVIDKKYIRHFKLGNAPWGVYGRSDVAPVLDDLRVLETIERSVAVISKYKAIPRKALMINKREGERPLSPQELMKLSKDISEMSDFESPILNRELIALDLSNGGSEVKLEPYIDYFKRKITVSMAPEFLIHGEEVNRATSREQKQTYFLRVASKRQNFEPKITRMLMLDVAGSGQKKLIGQFNFNFGEFDVTLPEEKETLIQDRFTKGIITLSEARAALDYPEVDGTDLFIHELTSPSDMVLGNESLREHTKENLSFIERNKSKK